MSEEEAVECAYCGCTEIGCLAMSPETGLYLCNGRGISAQSHFVDFILQTKNYEISFPKGHPYHETEFECYVCKSRNVLKLGFVTFTSHEDEVYICCRSPCQFDKTVIDGRIHNFHPIISDGVIIDVLLRQPKDHEYTAVPRQNIAPLIREVNERSMLTKFSGIPRVDTTYYNLSRYKDVMMKFIDLEESAYVTFEDSRKYNEVLPNWVSSTECNFKAHLSLFKACTVSTLMKFNYREYNVEAKVVRVTKDGFLHVKFFRECPFYGKTSGISCTVILNSFVFDRYRSALQKLASNKNSMHRVLFHVFAGNFRDVIKHNKSKLTPVKFVQPTAPGFPVLDTSQTNAVNYALTNHFSIIQGPPGTGKTTVIAAIANSFVSAGAGPVLILAQTNNAADFVTHRCVQAGLDPTRVYSYLRESVCVDGEDASFTCSIKGFDIVPYTSKWRAAQKYGAVYSIARDSEDSLSKQKCTVIEREIIRQSEVVVTTAATVGGSRFKQLKFPVVIYDEACQCVEPDIVIGATHGAERLILVGDLKQLGPLVISNEALLGRYNLSLMERAQLGKIHVSMLRMQYRMHPGISTLSSVSFYDGLIQDGVSELDRSAAQPVLPWPNPLQPLLFWNIESREEYYDYGTTFINKAEAFAVCQVVDRMLANGVKPSQIAVITPYTGQQIYINDAMYDFCNVQDKYILADIEVASVDAFQGREKDYIIISCVRANSSNDIGFFSDKRRLCVSLTRARYGLVIIGDATTFTQNETWWNLMEFLRVSECFVEGPLDNLRFSQLPEVTEFDNYYVTEESNPAGFI